MSSHLQPSGSLLESPRYIQGVMTSPAWSTFARPPQRYVAPSPRSYASKSRIEVHPPVWRRWVECSGFSVQTPDAKSVSPPLAIYDARERAATLTALHASPYRPSNYLSTLTALHNARRRQFTRDGQERQQLLYAPRHDGYVNKKHNFCSTLNASF